MIANSGLRQDTINRAQGNLRWQRAYLRYSAGRWDSSAASATLSQEALAEAAHLNRSYLSEIEGGLVAPSLLIVLRLARPLEVPVAKQTTGGLYAECGEENAVASDGGKGCWPSSLGNP